MKKIIYSLFALILCSTIAMAQTTLMSDEDHRIMMNDYAVNLNTVLTAELPQGLTIDQFKKKIVNGELSLSSTAQANILTYAQPLKTYGTQFATTKNLIATTDAEKIFLSSFAPSTVIDSSGNLVESATVAGLTATQMWECAIETLDLGDCSPFGVVGGNLGNIMLLAKTVSNTLTNTTGVLGVALVVKSFNDNLSIISVANYFSRLINFAIINEELADENMELFEQIDDAQFIPLLIENGFQNISLIENINSNIISNIKNIIQIATYEMNVNNISNIEDTFVLKNLTNRLEDSEHLSNFSRPAVGSSKNPILSRIKYSCALAIVGMLVVTGGAVTIIGGTAGSGTALAWFMVSKAVATLGVIDSCRSR